MIAADGATETLGKKNWAMIHSTDAFGMCGFKALAASLEKIWAKARAQRG